ncbi:unnamed protein product [Parajaminaea phylloscopi]
MASNSSGHLLRASVSASRSSPAGSTPFSWWALSTRAKSHSRKGKEREKLERKHSRLTHSLLKHAGIDTAAVESLRRTDEGRSRLHSSDLGWKRTGTAWRARRGNMANPPQRRSLATVADATVLHPAADGRGDVLPGDLLNVDVGEGLCWVVVLPSQPATAEQQAQGTELAPYTNSPSWQWVMRPSGGVSVINLSQIILHAPGILCQDDRDYERLQHARVTAEELMQRELETDPTDEGQNVAVEDVVSGNALAARTEVAFKLRKILRQVTTKTEQFRPLLYAMLGDEKSDLLAQSEVDVVQLARYLEDSHATSAHQGEASTSKPNQLDAALLGTHDLLMSLSQYFLWTARTGSYRHSHVFTVRPKGERDVHAIVSSWFEAAKRLEMNPVDAFITKARRVLDYGPAEANWNRQNIEVLSFLVDSVAVSFYSQGDPYDACVAYILNKLGRVPSLDLDAFKGTGPNKTVKGLDWLTAPYERRHDLVASLLEDLQIFGPTGTIDWSLAPGGPRRFLERVARRKRLASQRSEPLTPRDIDAELRQDFHGTVYVIDEPDAHELDDGICVDDTGLSDGKCWVHVHIADPTAYMRPDSPYALDAAQQGATLYFRSNRIPMLPDGLSPGMGSRKSVELGSSHEATPAPMDPVPSLRFSALVDAEGQVQETEVGVSRVHNVHITSYDDVTRIINAERGDGSKSSRDLRLMRDVTRRLRAARVRNGAFEVAGVNVRAVFEDPSYKPPVIPPSSLTLKSPVTTLTPLNGGNPVSLAAGKPRNVEPRLHFEVGTQEKMASTAQSSTGVVTECMILAGQIAAEFLARHEVAGPYRMQRFPSLVDAKWKGIMRGLTAKSPIINISDLFSAGVDFPGASYGAKPGEHLTVGIGEPSTRPANADTASILRTSGYCRATSPLRRYEDLVTHWQIKGILHRESFPDRKRKWPPVPKIWSLEEMQQMLPKIQRADEVTSALFKQSDRFWLHRALRQTLQTGPREPGAPDSVSTSVDKTNIPDGGDGKWHRLEASDLCKPMVAMIVRPMIAVSQPSKRCTIRVSLLSLGGLQANCLWPADPELTESGMERARGNPRVGELLNVKLRWAQEKVDGGGEIRVELAE